MATTETQQVDSIISSRRAMMVGGTALAALALTGTRTAQAQAAVTDNDILNFALNLEYLEANFYYAAAFGYTIDKAPTPISIDGGATAGSGITATVKPNPKVAFQSLQVASYAAETAIEEGKHVSFLSKTLGSAAVAQPQIDLMTSFDTLAAAAGIGSSFDPFSSDAFFLIGAYIFEDVGVSAYHGAAPLISTAGIASGILSAAAGILAVEAYHAGLVRTTINSLDPTDANGYQTLTNKISALRSKLSAAITASTTADDTGLGNQTVTLGATAGLTASTLADVDSNGIAWSRGATEVLNVVTGGASTSSPYKGVFFPAGLNGKIQ